MILRASRAAALAAGLATVLSACAAIWGFKEGADLPDGSATNSGVDAPSATDSAVDAARASEAGDEPDAGDEAADRGGPMDAAGDEIAIDSGAVTCSVGSVCLPQAPDGGWAGPYTIIEGSGSQLPVLPPCPAGTYSQPIFDGKGASVAPQAACTCSCAPSGGACAPPSLTYRAPSSGCAACSAPVPLAGNCTVLNSPSGQCSAVGFNGSAPVGIACLPDASTTVTPQIWTAEAHLCALPNAPTTGTCTAGEVCAPAATLPVESGTFCVALAGASSCPAVYYTVPRGPYYPGGGGNDSRGCSPCQCGSATGAVCTQATIATYTDSTCSHAAGAFSATTSCSTLGGAHAVSFDGGAPSGASCPALGGQPTGAFVPTAPYTICCNK